MMPGMQGMQGMQGMMPGMQGMPGGLDSSILQNMGIMNGGSIKHKFCKNCKDLLDKNSFFFH